MKIVFIRHGEPDKAEVDSRGFIGQGRDMAPLGIDRLRRKLFSDLQIMVICRRDSGFLAKIPIKGAAFLIRQPCVLFMELSFFSVIYETNHRPNSRTPVSSPAFPAPRYACSAGNKGTPRFRQRQARRRGKPPRSLSRCRRAASARSPVPGPP